MQPSLKLTRIVVALCALIVMASAALANQPDPSNVAVSNQKAGSVLVFPYYNSDGAQGNVNTRISISNVGASDDGPGESTFLHVFFLQGSNCQQADIFVCPTPNGSTVFDMNSFDPGIKGWILAVAVDKEGVPKQANRFIGNAYVRDNDIVGNYNATAFACLNPRPSVISNRTAATIFFDGAAGSPAAYDAAPNRHQVELLSPNDAQQSIVTVSLNVNIAQGGFFNNRSAGATGVSVWYDENEKGYSGPAWAGGCQNIYAVTANIRTAPRLGTVIPSGRSGQVAFNTSGTVGLLLTSNKKTDGTAAPWAGIRPLHNTRVVDTEVSSRIVIPIFMPTC